MLVTDVFVLTWRSYWRKLRSILTLPLNNSIQKENKLREDITPVKACVMSPVDAIFGPFFLHLRASSLAKKMWKKKHTQKNKKTKQETNCYFNFRFFKIQGSRSRSKKNKEKLWANSVERACRRQTIKWGLKLFISYFTVETFEWINK